MSEINKNAILVASAVVVGASIIGGSIIFSQSESSSGGSGSSGSFAEKIDYEKAALQEINNLIKRGDSSSPSYKFIRRWKIWTEKGNSLADLNNLNEREKAAFAFYAAEGGLVNTVKWLVEETNFDVNTIGDGGMVHRAAICRQYDVLKYLISKKADLSILDKDGQAPLSWALGHDIDANSLQMVKFLIENGADPLKTSGGRRRTKSLLHEAVENNSYEVAEYLLLAGKVNVNMKDGRGYTPLHYARNPRIRELLMRYGAR